MVFITDLPDVSFVGKLQLFKDKIMSISLHLTFGTFAVFYLILMNYWPVALMILMIS